jgi:cytochrome P450
MLVDELVCRAMELRKMKKPNSAPSETYVALESLLLHERDPEPIRDQFMNLLLAGRDSCGSLLCWIFYALAREPQLAANITEELGNIIGFDESRKPDKKQLNAMVKLDRFICEGEFSKTQSCDVAMADS